jgi:hypothetical protein
MAYVDIPKDLSEIRSKVAFGLTKKQLIGFGAAAAVGIPVFLTTRVAVGNDIGMILMAAAMALPLLYAIYEPKGMTVEQYAAAWLRFHFIAIGPRPYKNENIYDLLAESEATDSDAKRKDSISKKAGRAKRRAGRRTA